MVSKKFYHITAKAFKVSSEVVDGQVVATSTEIGEINYISTRKDESEARKQFMKAGQPLQRGSLIALTVGEMEVYSCSDEMFLSAASRVA